MKLQALGARERAVCCAIAAPAFAQRKPAFGTWGYNPAGDGLRR